MVKPTQTIRRLLPTNCLSVFDHFVKLGLKGLTFFECYHDILSILQISMNLIGVPYHSCCPNLVILVFFYKHDVYKQAWVW